MGYNLQELTSSWGSSTAMPRFRNRTRPCRRSPNGRILESRARFPHPKPVGTTLSHPRRFCIAMLDPPYSDGPSARLSIASARSSPRSLHRRRGHAAARCTMLVGETRGTRPREKVAPFAIIEAAANSLRSARVDQSWRCCSKRSSTEEGPQSAPAIPDPHPGRMINSRGNSGRHAGQADLLQSPALRYSPIIGSGISRNTTSISGKSRGGWWERDSRRSCR